MPIRAISGEIDVLPKLKHWDSCCFSRDCGINGSSQLFKPGLTLPPPEVDAPTCECLSLR